MHDNLGAVLNAQGRYAEAEVELRRALDLRLDQLGPEHVEVASSRMRLALALLEQDRAEEALPLAELASARLLEDGTRLAKQGDAVFLLARTRRATGGDRADARALARRAVRLYQDSGEEVVGSTIAEVKAWLRDLR